MINNNIKSQLFQCKCFCKSVKKKVFLSSEVQTDPICIFKIKIKKKKRKRRERKGKIKTCQIMLCTTNNRRGRRVGKKNWSSPACESIWEPGWGVERSSMDSRRSRSAPLVHPARDGVADQRDLDSGWRDRGSDDREDRRGGKRPDSSQDGDGVENVMVGLSTSLFRSTHKPPSPVRVNGEREGRRVTSENK